MTAERVLLPKQAPDERVHAVLDRLTEDMVDYVHAASTDTKLPMPMLMGMMVLAVGRAAVAIMGRDEAVTALQQTADVMAPSAVVQ